MVNIEKISTLSTFQTRIKHIIHSIRSQTVSVCRCGNMSFIDIQDPKKRDAIVADYLATKKRIQQRNLNERTTDLIREEERNELFKPIVASTEKSAATLQKELKGLKESIIVKKEEEEDDEDDDDDEVKFNKYEDVIKRFGSIKIDPYFRIFKEDDGTYTMGDKKVKLDKYSNIYVNGIRFKGTGGLWKLIMLKKPSKHINEHDRDNYMR